MEVKRTKEHVIVTCGKYEKREKKEVETFFCKKELIGKKHSEKVFEWLPFEKATDKQIKDKFKFVYDEKLN